MNLTLQLGGSYMYDYNYKGVFCQRLSELRMQKGISARDMSLSIGQSSSYINKIENQRTLPSLETFFVICEFLEIKPQDFFDLKVAYPISINVAVEELKKLDEQQLDRITHILKDINKR